MEKPVDEQQEQVVSVPAAPEGYQYVPIDPVVERRMLRKIDWVLIPLVFSTYLLAILDRSNIGNAHTAGMDDDLGMDDGQYQWLLTIFYIPYSGCCQEACSVVGRADDVRCSPL